MPFQLRFFYMIRQNLAKTRQSDYRIIDLEKNQYFNMGHYALEQHHQINSWKKCEIQNDFFTLIIW